MACVLAHKCNFLYWFFQCQLLEDTIDVEITVRMVKGIHTFKGDQTTPVISCRPWSSQLHPFPSLAKKMKTYLQERRNITNPFHSTCTYPDRPTILPFAKLQVPKKRKTIQDNRKQKGSSKSYRRRR